MFFVNSLPTRFQTSEGDHLVFRRTDLPESHALHKFACGMKDEIGKIGMCTFSYKKT